MIIFLTVESQVLACNADESRGPKASTLSCGLAGQQKCALEQKGTSALKPKISKSIPNA